MDHEGDPITHLQSFQQSIEVAAVFDEAIGAGPTVRQFVRIAHTDQVWGDAAAE